MKRWAVWLIILAAGAALWGAGAPGVGRDTADTLTIGAYSVVRDVLHEAILPRFAADWEQKTGRKLRFEESYSGSGAQARAISSGFDADVAILSLEGDIEKLVQAGLVRKDWKVGPHRGMITRSLVVIGYRSGNPQRIHDWDDLTKPGIGVVYPDPKTSGGARWNVNAIYGAGLFHGSRSHPDREAARELLSRVQSNVITMDASGRQSMATFDRGTGDADRHLRERAFASGQARRASTFLCCPAGHPSDRGTRGRRRRVRRPARQSQARRGLPRLSAIRRRTAHPRGLRLPTAGPGPRHQNRPGAFATGSIHDE